MRREAWVHLERVWELCQELNAAETSQNPPEILARLQFPDLAGKNINLQEVTYDIDRAEIMVRGYRATVSGFRPE